MKHFDAMRYERRAKIHRASTIVELGFRDIFWMLLGREIELVTCSKMVVIRNGVAYSTFNLDAGLGSPSPQ